jgi:hypothetical protein
MIYNTVMLALLGLLNQARAESVVLVLPDAEATGTPLAVVWIQGANYAAADYLQVAYAF